MTRQFSCCNWYKFVIFRIKIKAKKFTIFKFTISSTVRANLHSNVNDHLIKSSVNEITQNWLTPETSDRIHKIIAGCDVWDCMCYIKVFVVKVERRVIASLGPLYANSMLHDDVIKWKHFPRYCPFVRGIHRLPVNSPHKGQWRGGLVFSLICVWTNGWVHNRDAGDLRCHRALYDVTVMKIHI